MVPSRNATVPLGEPEVEEAVAVKMTALDVKEGFADAVSWMVGVSMVMV